VSISSIIITYQPDVKILSKLIFDNIDFLNTITLVDNGSNNIKIINETFGNNKKIKIISLEENLGIATAQNIGIKSLDVSDDELIVFFDQDSSVDDIFINNLESEYNILEKRYDDSIILGPTFFHRSKFFEYPVVRFDKYGFRKKLYVSNSPNEVEVSCIISSGMCVRKLILNAVGPMMDELFIDYVDTEWCMRAKSLGYKIFVSPKLVMEHEIGQDNIKILKWRVPVHTAARRYYRVRNSFLLRRYKYFPIVIVVKEVVFSILHQILLTILMKDRSGQFKSLCKGIRDGVFYKKFYKK
jgi:rhamnosyltransferase